MLFARCFAVFVVALAFALDSRRRAVNTLARIAADPNEFLAYERRLQHHGLVFRLITLVIEIGLIVLAIEGISRRVVRALPAQGDRSLPRRIG